MSLFAAVRAAFGSIAVIASELRQPTHPPHWLDESHPVRDDAAIRPQSPAVLQGFAAGMDPEVGEAILPAAPASTSGVLHDCKGVDFWSGAPGDERVCDVCGAVWVAEEFGPLDIKWVRKTSPAAELAGWWVGADRPVVAAAAAGDSLHGVPTFTAIQEMLLAYGDAHGELDDWLTGTVWRCRCGQELPAHDDGPYRALLEHCTELQASALSFAIQEARNT